MTCPAVWLFPVIGRHSGIYWAAGLFRPHSTPCKTRLAARRRPAFAGAADAACLASIKDEMEPAYSQGQGHDREGSAHLAVFPERDGHALAAGFLDHDQVGHRAQHREVA